MITYYVSSTGNDTNIGTNDGAPLKTARKAYDLAQSGDTILFKAGDRFTDQVIGNEYGGFDKSFITIGKYGNSTAPNPQFRAQTIGGQHIRFQGDPIIQNVIIQDLDFYALPPLDPYTDRRDAPISAYARGSGWILKNIRISGYVGGMNISAENMGDIQNCLFENIVVDRTYARLMLNTNGQLEKTHSGGFFLSKTTGCILRKCAALRVGWIPDSPLYIPTIFNQGFYMHGSNTNLLLDECLAVACSAGGIQLRGGNQTAQNCMSVGCPVGIGGGSETDYNSMGAMWTGSIRGCISWNTDDVTPIDPNASGRLGSPPHRPATGMQINFSDGGIVENNYIINGVSSENGGVGLQLAKRIMNTNIRNNTIFNWNGTLVSATMPTTNTNIRNNRFAGRITQTGYRGDPAVASFAQNKWIGTNPNTNSPEGPTLPYNDGIYETMECGLDSYYSENEGFDGTDRAAWVKLADERWNGKILNSQNVKNWLESRLADM